MITYIIAMLTMAITFPTAMPQEAVTYQVKVVKSADSGAIVPVTLTSIAE